MEHGVDALSPSLICSRASFYFLLPLMFRPPSTDPQVMLGQGWFNSPIDFDIMWVNNPVGSPSRSSSAGKSSLRDAHSETPGMANMIVKVTRVLLNYAVEEGYRPDNPPFKIKTFKLGEHRASTDEECAAFEVRRPSGSMQRRAYMLARFSGQRCGDIANMALAHRKNDEIRVVQQKTGTELWIPEHRISLRSWLWVVDT
jgi:hypothetical protein